MGQVAASISWPDPPNQESENLFCRARKIGLPILEERHCGSVIYNSGVGCAGIIGAPGLICKVYKSNNTTEIFKNSLHFRMMKAVQ